MQRTAFILSHAMRSHGSKIGAMSPSATSVSVWVLAIGCLIYAHVDLKHLSTSHTHTCFPCMPQAQRIVAENVKAWDPNKDPKIQVGLIMGGFNETCRRNTTRI